MASPESRSFFVIAAVIALCAFAPTQAAERFHKLSGPQIRSAIAGREFADGVHWADVFESGGLLTSIEMGKRTSGKWSVVKDELCLARGKDEPICYELWLAGNKAELRRRGSDLPLEGVLQTPAKRN